MRTVGTYLDAVLHRVPAMQKVILRSFRWSLISQPKELTFHQQCQWRPLLPVNLERDILLQMICDCGFEVKKVIEGLGEIGSSYSTRDLAVTVIARKAR